MAVNVDTAELASVIAVVFVFNVAGVRGLLGGHTPHKIDSVAVLPFVNASRDTLVIGADSGLVGIRAGAGIRRSNSGALHTWITSICTP
jgi:hypothetical protein